MRNKAKFLALLLITLIITGCRSETIAETPIPPLETILASPIVKQNINSIEEDAWNAISEFSQNLFLQVLAEDEENPIISPLSAYFALAMVAMGADDNTLEEFINVLGRDPNILPQELAALSTYLMDTNESTVLQLAGSVWVNDQFTVIPQFNEDMTNFFGAAARSRNFSDHATVDEINMWVYTLTRGLISEIIDEVSQDTAMLLINTLYVYSQWAEFFSPMNETKQNFYPENGNATEANFLSTPSRSFNVNLTNNFEAVMLPYNDNQLGFFMLRPTDGTPIRQFATTINISEIINDLTIREQVRVYMPELDKEFDILMNDALQTMGLESAFTPFIANFPGLVKENDPPLFISRVLQRVRIIVDKEGTEAAAVTMVEAMPASAPAYVVEPITLTFNTPYIYVMYDRSTGIPLFMGVVDRTY